MRGIELNDKNLVKVNSGAGDMVGMNTPLGEFSAEDLIAMYENDPAGAKSYISLAKAWMPQLITDFRQECKEKGLTIPAGLEALLG